MAKKPDNAYDRELASKGLERTQVLEVVAQKDGTFASVYRERIVPISNGKVLMRQPIRISKSPKQGTNLSYVIKIVKEIGPASRKELINKIVEMLGVTEGNAGVYLSKAMKLI